MSSVEPLARVQFQTNLNEAPPHMTDTELFADARELFNSERYWECHEVLEGKWRTLSGEEKALVQGIILVCAALVHHQKDEEDTGIGILRRAVGLLVWNDKKYGGFDVSAMRNNVESILASGLFSVFRV